MIDINHNFTKEFNFFRPFERIYYCFEFTLLIFYSFEYFQNAVHQVIVSLFNMKKSKRNCSLYIFFKKGFMARQCHTIIFIFYHFLQVENIFGENQFLM